MKRVLASLLFFVLATGCAKDAPQTQAPKGVGPTGSGSGSESPSSGPEIIPNTFTVRRGIASAVNGLSVLVSGAISLGADALAVTQKQDGSHPPFQALPYYDGVNTTIRLSFSQALIDDNYTLSLEGSQIHDEHGVTLVGGDQSFGFYQLRWDLTGDRIVNGADYIIFKAAYGSARGSAAYNPILDVNSDGLVNADDFTDFKKSFGIALP